MLTITGKEEEEFITQEAKSRDLRYVNLDTAIPKPGKGKAGCVLALLSANLVYGTPQQLARYEQRLPVDLLCTDGSVPSLPKWQAARRAYITFANAQNNATKEGIQKGPHCKHALEIELPTTWEDEIAWRVPTRSAKAKMLESASNNKLKTCSLKMGKTCTWKMERIQRAALPSILEILQKGFKPCERQYDRVVLTDGSPKENLKERLVSLIYQQRMHPHTSAFPREPFYLQASGTTLLHDSKGMEEARKWGYTRDTDAGSHGHWVSLRQRGRGSNANNVNRNEAEVLMTEMSRFVTWALKHPLGHGKCYTVAVPTFWRGQEKTVQAPTKSNRPSGQYPQFLPSSRGKQTQRKSACNRV